MSTQRLTHFDGLRGIAACMVFFSHLLCAFYPATNSGLITETHTLNHAELFFRNTPLNVLFNGEFAVCIFFAISGYVLSYHFFINPDKKKIAANIIKRYPRLMILVWVSVLFSFILQELHVYHTTEAASLTMSSWLQNLFAIPQSFGNLIRNIGYEQFLKHNTPTPLNPVLWTIATELKGSLLVFLILLISPRNAWRYAIYAALFVYYFKGYFMLFIFGVALADLSNSRLRHIHLPIIPLIVLFALSILFGSYKSDTGFIGWQWMSGLEQFTKPNFIGAIILVFVVCYQPGIRVLLNKKPSQWLGKISYSLYLFHLVMVCALITPLLLTSYKQTGNYHMAAVLSISVIIAFTFVICRYVFTPVDEWSIRISNRLAKTVRRLING